jgi:peptide-methionine (S)-S-oxide reductase
MEDVLEAGHPTEDALPGRDQATPVPEQHEVLGTPLLPPYPEGIEQIVLGMGCFWGAERVFWQTPGVYSTAVGYAGGQTPNPTYREVCSGRTGHAEVVLVAFDPTRVSLDEILRRFWEGHDPTQGMRQGNDVGTQYRSAIYWNSPAQRDAAIASRDRYAAQPVAARLDHDRDREAGPFYAAEDITSSIWKNPGGYWHSPAFRPVGVGVTAAS